MALQPSPTPYETPPKSGAMRKVMLAALLAFMAGGALVGWVMWYNLQPGRAAAPQADAPAKPASVPANPTPLAAAIKAEQTAERVAEQQGGLDQRLAAPKANAPEMCSLNMGSMNFALYPAIARIREFRHAWEKPFLENTDDLVFKNTPRDIARVLKEMGEERGARFEFECYDLSHLTMLRHFVDRGAVRPPFFIQFVFGVLGGMAAEPDTLTHLKRTADRLFGSDYMFSVLAAGRAQIPMATIAAAMGGHVRVGLEDSLYIAKGKLARSNAEQVRLIRGIVEGLGREVATPDEVRGILGLKGREKVGF
jgi:uncharacterized protein (DUF849 family)